MRIQSIRMAMLSLTLASLLVLPATSSAQELDPAEQARVDRVWNRYWRDVAPFYLKHGDGFVCVPGYDRRLPSSMGLSAEDYQRQTAREVAYTDERGRDRTRVEVKPTEEAAAAVHAMPEVEAGVYGHILSGRISEIADDQTVILEDIWLVDAEQVERDKAQALEGVVREAWSEVENRIRRARDGRRDNGDTIAEEAGNQRDFIRWAFEDREDLVRRQRSREFSRLPWRIVGFKTETLRSGERWPAEQTLQLVIVEVTSREVVAVPAARLSTGLTELEMLDLIEARSITKAQFVDLMNEARREHGRDYLPVVLALLEGDEPVAQEVEAAGRENGGGGAVELAD